MKRSPLGMPFAAYLRGRAVVASHTQWTAAKLYEHAMLVLTCSLVWVTLRRQDQEMNLESFQAAAEDGENFEVEGMHTPAQPKYGAARRACCKKQSCGASWPLVACYSSGPCDRAACCR